MSWGPGSGRLSLRCLLLAAVLAAVLTAPSAGASVAVPRRTAYAGLGTWLSIYAKKQWRHPERQVAAMARDGVRTLYLQTGNYRQKVDLVHPAALGRFVDAAHAAGLRVVAWYLPSFYGFRADERRSLAAIRFRSPAGEGFDSFALDIEATVVRHRPLRNRRLLHLSAWLRREAGPGYALGAITPSPVGMSPSYWPNIPYRRLARFYDVFLPMAYSTDRDLHGSRGTLDYLAATVAAIRARLGAPTIPIHLIGGISGSMGRRATAEFMQAVADCRPLGYSLYDFPTTRPTAWTALTRAARPGSRGCS